nr:hypothetical protein [Halorientalis regularis]
MGFVDHDHVPVLEDASDSRLEKQGERHRGKAAVLSEVAIFVVGTAVLVITLKIILQVARRFVDGNIVGYIGMNAIVVSLQL